MKKLFIIFALFLFCGAVFADTADTETTAITETIQTENNKLAACANQEITATENKVIVAVQKCPMNENANQKIILKKNWFVVFVQVNGKVKVNPANIEVE